MTFSYGAASLALALALTGLSCSASSGPSSTVVSEDAGPPRDASDDKGATDAAADGGVCPSDLPPSCPATVPSFTTDVAPLIQSRCATCHSPSGTAGYYETTYAQIAGQQSAILDQVYDCMMPPIGAPKLTTAQRETLLTWLVCNAPDN